jgi:DNA-binding MarR family transcriptional regulator
LTGPSYVYILLFMAHDHTDVRDCTCNNLRKAARAVTQYYDEALRPSGIRATQFSLLSAIKEFGTVSIGVLAEESVMDRTTLTRNLKLLEDEGLITVAPGKDARVREVSLTPQAHERLAAATRYWRKAQAHMASTMGTDGVRHLLRALSVAVEAVRSE